MGIGCTNSGILDLIQECMIASRSLQERLEKLPALVTWALKHLQLSDNGMTIARSLRGHQAITVSNGGLKYGLEMAAFVLEGQDSIGQIKGMNRVPGLIQEGDSHCCELSGLYAVILLVKEISHMHQITQEGITVYCDNETALCVFDPDFSPDPKMKNFDLISACWSQLHTTPIDWKAVHVKGHQD
jgi:hypothetical protein